jgi:hypothetical protein
VTQDATQTFLNTPRTPIGWRVPTLDKNLQRLPFPDRTSQDRGPAISIYEEVELVMNASGAARYGSGN